MAIEYTENMWKNISDTLKHHGIEVFSPAAKVGDCLSEYVVVSDAGSLDLYGISSYADYYDVTLHVPKLKYSLLDPFKMKVRMAMTDLLPMIVPTTQTFSSMYDENIKAHTLTIEYYNVKMTLSKFDNNRRL